MNSLSFIDFGSDPRRNMQLLLQSLSPSEIVPEPNKYYTFIYKAKSRGITYDQNPLILCGSVFSWGFNGLNSHWNAVRQYSWNEVLSNVYPLSDEEFNYLQNIPLAYFRTT